MTGSDVDNGDFVQSFRVIDLPSNGTLFLDPGLTQPVVAGTNYDASGNPLTLYFEPNGFFAGTTHFHYVRFSPIAPAPAVPRPPRRPSTWRRSPIRRY